MKCRAVVCIIAILATAVAPAVASFPDSLQAESTGLDSLEAKLARNRLTRELARYVFQPSALPLDAQAAVTPAVDFFTPFAGLVIRNIVILRLDVFNRYDPEGVDAVQTTLSRIGDALHVNTRVGIIQDYLLVHAGEGLDPSALADSERLLRGAPFIQEANIVVAPVPSAPDSADLYVVTRDRWTLGVDVKIKNTESADIRLADRNFAGWGHHFENLLLVDGRQTQEFGYVGRYRIDNIQGSFVRNAYEYRDTYRDRTWSMAVFRNREAPQIRTTGALAVASTHLKSPQPGIVGEAFVEGGLWAGRALPVGRASFGGLSRKAIVPAVGWSTVDFTERPDSVTSTYNRRYQDRHLFLSSLSYTQSDFEHGRLLWGYGWTEDIPHGLLATLTGGLELGEFETRGYGGGELRAAKYTGFGYLGIRAAAGAFIHERMVEDGVVDVSVGYFSRLLAAGGFGFRQFVNTSYTIGFRRSENDPIPLDPTTGLAAGISGSSLRDRARLIGGLESVLFSPWTAYGFRFAFFGKFDIGTLGREADSFLDGKYYSMVGFGIRLHNERLVFEPTELRFSVAVSPPPGASSKIFDFGSLSTTPLPRLDPGAPALIPYR